MYITNSRLYIILYDPWLRLCPVHLYITLITTNIGGGEEEEEGNTSVVWFLKRVSFNHQLIIIKELVGVAFLYTYAHTQ